MLDVGWVQVPFCSIIGWYEARTLAFLQSRLPFAVADWRIVTPELVAYPMLTDTTAIVVDAATGTVE